MAKSKYEYTRRFELVRSGAVGGHVLLLLM